MHPVVKREVLSPNVTRLEIEASRIAQVRRPGQFVIVQLGDEFAERIPLTIADADPEAGTITLDPPRGLLDDEAIVVVVDGAERRIEMGDIASARTVFVWEKGAKPGKKS